MDEQARLLDKNLEKLTNMKLPADLEKTLDRIQAQWAFIRGSFINYNENNVYYVVNRYSRRIVELFNEMLASLESA